MAFTTTTVGEVRTTGSDNNGGFFDSAAAGVDRSQQDAAHASGTNLTVDGTTATDVLPDGYTPSADDVGNAIQITAGAGFTLKSYLIKSIQSGKWRLDSAPAATSTSGGTWALGGALASPGKACGLMVLGATAGVLCWIKSGTYDISSSTANVSGGRVNWTLHDGPTQFIGYSTARGDLTFGLTGRPVFRATTSMGGNYTVTLAGRQASIWHIEIDGNSQANTFGLSINENSVAAHNVYVHHCAGRGMFVNFGTTRAVGCEVSHCVNAGETAFYVQGGRAIRCYSHDNTGEGFRGFGNGTAFNHCLSARNTVHGFLSSVTEYVNCIAHANGSNGFSFAGGSSLSTLLLNCLATNNTGYGFGSPDVGRIAVMLNCAGYSNGSGNAHAGLVTNLNFVTLTASPYTNAATSDFTLNTTAGGGAALRAAGFATFSGLTPVGYPDIGAYQSRGGGLRASDMRGGMNG
jgi:hypothetical protein